MELTRAIRSRRMVRDLRPDPLDPDELDRLLDLARRAPSAGNTAAVEFLLLSTPDDVASYWATTFDQAGRQRFRWQGLLTAPALVLITTRPDAYPARYAEPDKATTGRGRGLDAWPQPFWWVDAGAVAQNVLLLAVDAGWGACLFGVFDHEAEVRRRFGIPDDRRIVATIALGHPGKRDEPGRSSGRRRRPLDDVVHRGRWRPDDRQ